MKYLLSIVALTLTAAAADVEFEWIAGENATGHTLYVIDTKAGTTNTVDVLGSVTTATVALLPKSVSKVHVRAWAEHINDDGSKVKLLTGPSNELTVRIPGRAENIVVKSAVLIVP